MRPSVALRRLNLGDPLQLTQRSFDERLAHRLVVPQLVQRGRCSGVQDPEHAHVRPGAASHRRYIPLWKNAKRAAPRKALSAARETRTTARVVAWTSVSGGWPRTRRCFAK